MSLVELEKIKSEFLRLSLHPTYLKHEPVITSEDAAKTRGFSLKQGVKALLFTDQKNNWVIVDVPADKKVDEKKVAAILGWSKNAIRIATPEKVFEITGCEIGSVPPFGHKTNVPILVDPQIFENTENAFNIGLRTDSVKISTAEMEVLFKDIGVTFGNFTK